MKRKNIIMCIIAMAIAIIPCYGQQQKKIKGLTHGKEKAYNGAENPGLLKELRLTIIENDVETTDLEMKLEHEYYIVKYEKNGKSYRKTLNPSHTDLLQMMLETSYTHDDHYQDYKLKKGPKNTEWHFCTKHANAVVLINGTNMTPENFNIVKAVISFIDHEFELNETNTPFPEGKVTYFYYSDKGSMRPGGPEWTVTRESDGLYKVKYFDDRGKFEGREPVTKEKVYDAKVGDDLLEIFKKGKIQNYKSEYVDHGVTDGSRWKFEVKFESGKSVRSGGYMDGPRDSSGINDALKYLNKLME